MSSMSKSHLHRRADDSMIINSLITRRHRAYIYTYIYIASHQYYDSISKTKRQTTNLLCAQTIPDVDHTQFDSLQLMEDTCSPWSNGQVSFTHETARLLPPPPVSCGCCMLTHGARWYTELKGKCLPEHSSNLHVSLMSHSFRTSLPILANPVLHGRSLSHDIHTGRSVRRVSKTNVYNTR